MTDSSEDQFAALCIRDLLQIVEYEWLGNGYDEITVTTERGTFMWHTDDRARELAAKGTAASAILPFSSSQSDVKK